MGRFLTPSAAKAVSSPGRPCIGESRDPGAQRLVRVLLTQLRGSRHEFDPQLPPEAACALLGPMSGYSGDSAAFIEDDRDKVAFPLVEVLEAEAAALLMDVDGRMLRDEGENERQLQNGRNCRYIDVRWRRDPVLMREFMGLLAQMGLLAAVREVRGRVSSFFMRKKKGSQRLVLDCRRSNCAFRGAPFTQKPPRRKASLPWGSSRAAP